MRWGLSQFVGDGGKMFLKMHDMVLSRFSGVEDGIKNSTSAVSQAVTFYLEDKMFDFAQKLGYGHRSSTHSRSVFEVGITLQMEAQDSREGPKSFIYKTFMGLYDFISKKAVGAGYDLNTPEDREKFDQYFKINSDNMVEEY